MMKWLKIVSLALVIWGTSLLWLDLNTVLTESLMLGLVTGLALLIPTYWLGYYFGRSFTRPKIKQPQVRATPSASRFYSYLSHARPTLPMPVVRRYHHSQPTRPMAHL